MQRTVEPGRTSLHLNPFAVLAASTTHGEQGQVEQNACAELADPGRRLMAEMAWLPGVSPQQAALLLDTLVASPASVQDVTNLPALPRANLLAAMFERSQAACPDDQISTQIGHFAALVDTLEPQSILRTINADRSRVGFPPHIHIAQVEGLLSERKKYYRQTVKSALSRLSSPRLVEAIIHLADSMTVGGTSRAPELVYDLTDTYATLFHAYLEQQARHIRQLMVIVREHLVQQGSTCNEGVILSLIQTLATLLRHWHYLTRPIQLSAKARDLTHIPSTELAAEVRRLAIDAYRNLGLLDVARQITTVMEEVFADVPEAIACIKDDAIGIASVADGMAVAHDIVRQKQGDFTFEARIGPGPSDTLRISSDGVACKGRRMALADIKTVRWGKTAAGYLIAVGDNGSELVIDPTSETIYSAFVQSLWKGVGSRLLVEHVLALESGRDLYIGEAVLRDSSIDLIRHGADSAINRRVSYPWHDVQMTVAPGYIVIAAKNDTNSFVRLSTLETANAQILEMLLRMAFQKCVHRISDAFSSESG
jgi:hypothetical protein